MLAVAKRSFSAFTCHGSFFVTDLKQFDAHPPFGSKPTSGLKGGTRPHGYTGLVLSVLRSRDTDYF